MKISDNCNFFDLKTSYYIKYLLLIHIFQSKIELYNEINKINFFYLDKILRKKCEVIFDINLKTQKISIITSHG